SSETRARRARPMVLSGVTLPSRTPSGGRRFSHFRYGNACSRELSIANRVRYHHTPYVSYAGAVVRQAARDRAGLGARPGAGARARNRGRSDSRKLVVSSQVAGDFSRPERARRLARRAHLPARRRKSDVRAPAPVAGAGATGGRARSQATR